MTDTSDISAKIEAEVARIRADVEQEATKLVADAQAEADRVGKLIEAKARCLAECGQVSDAIAATDDPKEKAALVTLQTQVHAGHDDGTLAAAYQEFSGQTAGESNPATPGVTTPLEAAATPVSDAQVAG